MVLSLIISFKDWLYYFSSTQKQGQLVFLKTITWPAIHNHVRFTFQLSFFPGKSTHNQRIERLWRDVFQGCLILFYDLFYHLESCNLLNPNDDVHLWCLHFVYMPIINNNLRDWSSAWARHPIRTARNQSPLQLWIRGLQITFRTQLSNNAPIGEVSIDFN